MTDVGRRPGAIARDTYQLGRAVPALLSEVTGAAPWLSRELQFFVGVGHALFLSPPPHGFEMEYTAQSFSVSECLTFWRARSQIKMDWSEAAEEIQGDASSRLVFTCEHASNALPEPWRWPEADRWLVDTHWASDIGAGAFTRRVAGLMNAPAVLSRFSRLLVDPNRPLDSDTLFRQNADGHQVHLNEALLETERERRVERFYKPYHAAVSGMIERSQGDTVFAIHTFTDNYEGDARMLELGVLFDDDEEPAHQLIRHLEGAGFHVLANEPWSGKGGLAYSPVRHAKEFGWCALEIEARQDLIVQDAFAQRLAEALASFFA